MDKQQIANFESQIKEFNNNLRQLTGGDSLDGLIKVIHQPGWTTIADIAFVGGILDSMVSQARTLNSLKQVLLSGASKVELNPQPLPPKQEGSRQVARH
jgi:hypothetical protein